MKEPQYYQGREQTYLKHFFLEKYLERVGLIIGFTRSEFVYVDGFSGPWRSEDQEFEDTSFMIAIRRLRKVKAALREKGKEPRIRCVFVEANPKAFAALESAIAKTSDIQIHAINGEFESVLPEIQSVIGGSFALTFIDPTGWTGFALEAIEPLLRVRGEVLINFMYDHVNRFLGDKREPTAHSFNRFFGGAGWQEAVEAGGEAPVELYRQRLKRMGGFKFVTQTRVLFPMSDRPYFYLVYGTRHAKGLKEFRDVERSFLYEQEQVRADAQQDSRIKRSGQDELFRERDGASCALQNEIEKNRSRARSVLLEMLSREGSLGFTEAWPHMLELPMVNMTVAKDIMVSLEKEGLIEVHGKRPRQRKPDVGCILIAAHKT